MKKYMRYWIILLTLSLFVFSLTFALRQSEAAKRSKAAPSLSGTLTDTSGPLTYTAGPFFVPNPSAQANGMPICNAALPCDDYTLTVAVPSGYATTYRVKIEIGWPVSAADFDVYILQGANIVATAASSSDPEVASLPAVSGTYLIRVVPFAPAGQSITGHISLVPVPPPPPSGSGIAPRYKNYAAPPSAVGAESSGEPSIGVDWNPNVASLKHGTVNTGGVAFYTSNLHEFRVSFDDCSSPASSLWEDVTSPTESATSLDPIGFVDHQTGRVFQSQLAGATSVMAYSDDDGQTWTQSQGAGVPAGADHQTLGGGPYNESALPPPIHPLYANQIYYCSQSVATAFCARSDDGGLTFGPGVAIYNLTQCGGLHGHIKVGPDGTAYVPNKGCGGAQGVAVSTDNGLTWAVRTVPGSTPGDTDPSVGIGADNTLYFGYQNGDGHPHIARSTDKGLTWVDRDAGGGFIQNCVFAEVVAGDGDRAAFAFLGTPTGGNYQDATNFHGIWHLYVATTFDRGNTYLLTDATPDDPVQVGSICTSGTTCGDDRNLLDFNDITVDKEGRVLVGYADGCVAPGCNASSPSTASRSALGTISRQSGGRRLFAAYDPTEPSAPAAPHLISATRDATGVTVSWEVPDDGGSPITGYNIYRGTTSGGETFLTSVGPSITKYLDTTASPNTQYYYRVSAVNAIGESSFCSEVAVTAAPPPPNPCAVPGVTILTDPTGDELDMLPSHDIQSISVAEPAGVGSGKLVFTIKMADLSTVPPSTIWPVSFTAPNMTSYFVKMETDATATVRFAYGSGSDVTVAGTTADPASTYNQNGTITIVVPDSGIGNLTAGQTISSFLMRVRVQPAGVTPDNCPNDLGPTGSYTLVGNSFCVQNNAPTAVLDAMPTTGPAPLIVNFDAGASSDPDSDAITTYEFDFGDGSAVVTQSTPTISHTYTASGNYRATLRVTDARGKQSSNLAQVIIEVSCFNPATPPKPIADFDGDGKTDLSVFRPSDGNWYIRNSSNGSVTSRNWGLSSDVLVPGDYDGDKKTDIAVWRPSDGNWYIINSSTATVTIVGWGQNGDKPVPGDYDGDGKNDQAVFRPSEGNWYVKKSTGGSIVQGWGNATDHPVAGDYDGDGKNDIAVYRPEEGNWYIIRSSGGVIRQNWGASLNDRPIQADYDADGKTDVAIYRLSEFAFYLRKTCANPVAKSWGIEDDVPAAADYDGDGQADITIFRPAGGEWWIINSATNTVIKPNFGQSGDIPIPSVYHP